MLYYCAVPLSLLFLALKTKKVPSSSPSLRSSRRPLKWIPREETVLVLKVCSSPRDLFPPREREAEECEWSGVESLMDTHSDGASHKFKFPSSSRVLFVYELTIMEEEEEDGGDVVVYCIR